MTKQHRVTGSRQTQKPKTKNKKKNENRDSDDCLQDFPEWLEEFAENLEDTEVLAPAHISRTQIRNVLRKWHQNKKSIMFTFTSHKTKIAISACAPKLQRSLQKTLAKTKPRAQEFGDLITADHIFIKEEGESRNNHRPTGTLSWYKN